MPLPQGSILTINFEGGGGVKTIATIHTMSGTDPVMEMHESTALDTSGNYRTYETGMEEPGEVTITGRLLGVGNTDSIIAARDAGTLVTCVITYSLGYTSTQPKSTFTAYITSFKRPFEKGQPMDMELVLKISGAVTEAAGADV